MILGPLQFAKRIRARHMRIHRWSGRIFVASGIVIGISALRLGFVMPYSGSNETAATTFFGAVFLFALMRAFYHIRRREITAHREWMIRAFLIGIAIATIRPVVVLYQLLSGLAFRESLGIAFWLSFTAHALLAEVWINSTRRSPAPHPTNL